MKILVTMPAYDEEATIGGVIKGIRDVMDKGKYNYGILVIDDGSSDKTSSIAKHLGATVVSHLHNMGLAEAFRTEMTKAMEMKADAIVHIDADGQYRAEEIPKLLSPIMKGEADLVLGSRFLGKIEEMPLSKRLGNIAFSRAISNIIRIKISDCQTGFRAFTPEVAQRIKIISDHTYTQEMIIKAAHAGFRIREVPIYFAKRRSGESKLVSSPLEYAAKAWINIIRIYRDYAPLKFFGGIGAGLMFISFLLGLYILEIFITGKGGLYQKIPTLFVIMLFFVTGLQIATFGLLADMKKEEK